MKKKDFPLFDPFPPTNFAQLFCPFQCLNVLIDDAIFKKME